MIFLNTKKVMTIAFLIISLFPLFGCGKKYEAEITKGVRESCKIPDSFKKVDYQIDEENGIAYLDYKAKNIMGVEIPDRIYFAVSDNGFKGIPTEEIDKQTLKKFYENAPASFEICVYFYSTLEKMREDMRFDLDSINNTRENIETSDHDNYYVWESYKNDAKKLNYKIKKIKDSYANAPSIVKDDFKEIDDLKYTKVTLTGNWDSWDAKSEQVDEFPE